MWGNCSQENLNRLLKIQKRCARLIVDANISANSVTLFNNLGWLPIDDIINIKKLCVLYKISRGLCPEYFKSYLTYISTIHRYHTRSANNNNIITPKCNNNSGLRTFHSSACRLWNKIDLSQRNVNSYRNFKKALNNKFLENNRLLQHFHMTKTY